MARILIDGRFVGVGDSQTRLVLELVKGVLALDKKNEYTLLIRPQGEKEIERYPEIVDAPNTKIVVLDIPHYSVAEQTKLLQYLNEEKFDLVHFTQFNHPIFYRGKYVITIQDLTLVGHLHRESLLKKIAFGTVMRSAARNSAKIITISGNTMDDVIEYYNVPKDKFTVTYLGVDHDRFNDKIKNQALKIKQFKEKYSIMGDYILYTGMWKRHKNLKRLLLAFEKFLISNSKFLNKSQNPNPKVQLVLVGKVDEREPEVIKLINQINSGLRTEGKGPREKEIADLKPKTQDLRPIVTTGFIEEEELPLAYAGALAYTIPSLSEGFGWPPLEAMACGTAVIASKESCIPEILGEAPLYFDAYNIEDIASKIEDVSTNEGLRSELVTKGYEQVKKYNWEDTAKKTLAVYEELLG